MAASLAIIIAGGVFLRYSFIGTSAAAWLASRNEISTPVTSWKRVAEGLSLQGSGISPYEGETFHQSPLLLELFRIAASLNWSGFLPLAFIIIDLLTSLVIGFAAEAIAAALVRSEQSRSGKFSPSAKQELTLADRYAAGTAAYATAAYLFNPIAVASCVAQSTAVVDNLVVALTILSVVKGGRFLSTFCIALATYQSLYPLVMLAPAALVHLKQPSPTAGGSSVVRQVSSVLLTVFLFGAWLSVLLLVSYHISGSSWRFLYSTYGFLLSVPDLTPNVGLFWYFFTEIFEHFRVFFICIFQINVVIYTFPLTIKLRHHPEVLMYVLLVIISLFKSYPSHADTSVYISLLPTFAFIAKYMRNNFIVVNAFVWTTLLFPILWHLWIYAGSANANFYFALTLVYNCSQIFFITDFLYSFLRREYDLLNFVKTSPEDTSEPPKEEVLLQ